MQWPDRPFVKISLEPPGPRAAFQLPPQLPRGLAIVVFPEAFVTGQGDGRLLAVPVDECELTMASSSSVFEKSSAAMLNALRQLVFRHEIFVEAREFDDDFIFTRKLRRRSKRLGPRRHFELFLRRHKQRVRFCTLTCGSEDQERSEVRIDVPEKALLLLAEAAIEYEESGRDAKRYAARFPRSHHRGLRPPSASRAGRRDIVGVRKTTRRARRRRHGITAREATLMRTSSRSKCISRFQ